MRFSAVDAAFEGFRVTRRHPWAVLGWAAVMLAANLASAFAVGVVAGPAWMEAERLAASTSPDPAAAAALAPKVLPAALLYLIVQIVGAAVVNASVLRALLRPERRAYIGFGRDELRVIGLLAMFVGATFFASLLLSLALGILAMVLGPVVAALAPAASLAVLIVLTIRFSLAGPATIAEHRFQFRSSWIATRGWFGPLLGAGLLAAALAMVVMFLGHIVFVGAAGALLVAQGGNLLELASRFQPDFSSAEQTLRPLPLVYVAVLSVLYALVLVILVAPPVELYRALHGEGQAQRP